MGYDLNADWNGARLHGRIGGRLEGRDLILTLNGERVDGRVGGHIKGFDADGTLTATRLQARLGGRIEGDDASADLTDTTADGRFSGKDINLHLDGDRLTGRIGGTLNGKDVNLRVNGVPFGLAVLAAVCAYKAKTTKTRRRKRTRNGGIDGHSTDRRRTWSALGRINTRLGHCKRRSIQTGRIFDLLSKPLREFRLGTAALDGGTAVRICKRRIAWQCFH
ncbi:hypothetical protein [Deinococcus sp.]|uniref:hypothetical protein n=1 Tax=Deinococcus sp. TaxID=47478 RepID=UPI003C7AF5A4